MTSVTSVKTDVNWPTLADDRCEARDVVLRRVWRLLLTCQELQRNEFSRAGGAAGGFKVVKTFRVSWFSKCQNNGPAQGFEHMTGLTSGGSCDPGQSPWICRYTLVQKPTIPCSPKFTRNCGPWVPKSRFEHLTHSWLIQLDGLCLTVCTCFRRDSKQTPLEMPLARLDLTLENKSIARRHLLEACFSQ